MTNDNLPIVFAVIAGSGVVLFLVGLGVLAVRDQPVLGGALMAAGVADLIAAIIIRSRMA